MLTNSVVKGIVISSFTHFPKKLSSEVAFILSTQYRLIPIDNKRSLRLRFNKEFDLALSLLKLRALGNEELSEECKRWGLQKKHHEDHTGKHGHSRRSNHDTSQTSENRGGQNDGLEDNLNDGLDDSLNDDV